MLILIHHQAFAAAIKKAFPTSVRLSIHMSENLTKLPISLLSKQATYTTPWHCTSALEVDGSWRFSHGETFAQDPDYELIYRYGRPSYYRRKSDLYSWSDVDVEITPIQPCGLMITPRSDTNLSTEKIDMQKARKLAELNSPIVFRAFKNTTDRELFTRKGRELGTVMPWKFGEVLVVKDAGMKDGGLNNVLSAEPMPMHFDGIFKTIKVRDEDGKERLVPQPPQ